MLSFTVWNNNIKAQSNYETNCKAVAGDIVEKIGGYLFLVQRKNDYNNIIFIADTPTRPIILAFRQMLQLLKNVHHIQYVRVEGLSKRYKKIGKYLGVESVVATESPRRVQYLKLF